MLKKFLIGAFALVLSTSFASAVITGTWSEKQDEQAAIGQLQPGMGTATGNSPTISNGSGVITTAALTTAAGATQAITLTNTRVAAGDAVLCTVDPGASAGTPICANAAVTAGQVVFTIQNIHASAALNAAVKVYFVVLKAGNTN